MSVYVDALVAWTQEPKAGLAEQYFGRGRQSCHLWADSAEELQAIAKKIGLRWAWVQQSGGPIPLHFDLTPGKRRAALTAGAQETTILEYLRKTREQKEEPHG